MDSFEAGPREEAELGFLFFELDDRTQLEAGRLQPAKRFGEAMDLVDKATDPAFSATDRASLKNMALVGRARARLDANNMSGAAADATLVPPGFVRNAEFSETTVSRSGTA